MKWTSKNTTQVLFGVFTVFLYWLYGFTGHGGLFNLNNVVAELQCTKTPFNPPDITCLEYSAIKWLLWWTFEYLAIAVAAIYGISVFWEE